MAIRRKPGLLTICLLVGFLGVGFAEELPFKPGTGSLPPEVLDQLSRRFPQKKSLAGDLAALTAGYPGLIQGVDLSQGKLYLIMKNRVKILYDDGLMKDFEEKLDRPDLEDMLAQPYRPGKILGPLGPDEDPGRFRVNPFFKAVYGGSAGEVQVNLVPVTLAGARVMFNTRNGAAQALEKVGRDLAALVARQPRLRQYVFPLGGTFVWRDIAGTSRLSPHSWGIAIDLNPRQGAYWRNQKVSDVQAAALRNRYPHEIVEVFEKHGFIWGGKWSHFDLMHFEYRPELLKKWQLSGMAGSTPSEKLAK